MTGFTLNPILVSGRKKSEQLSSKNIVKRPLSALYNRLMRERPWPSIRGCEAGIRARIPQHGRALIVSAVFRDLVEGERVVAPLRALGTPLADRIAPRPYPTMFAQTKGDTMRGLEYDGRSLLLETMSDEALDTLAQEAVVFMAPRMIVQLRVLGGAMSRMPADATAFAHRDAADWAGGGVFVVSSSSVFM